VPPPAKASKAKKEPKAMKSQVDKNDEQENDVMSIIVGEEPAQKKIPATALSENGSEDEGRWAFKSETKSQLKSESKPKKHNAPLPTFKPQATGIDIIDNPLLPRPCPETKKETAVLLSSIGLEMGSGPRPARGRQPKLSQKAQR
jgi:hypothetical protein